MARIFTIEFNYKNEVHRAMIAVRETPFHKEYKITLPDDGLSQLLVSDKIVSTESGTLLFANTSTLEYNELMKQILRAVTTHIHSLQH